MKGSANVLDDRIKIQNDLDKAEHWDETHKMKLTDMLWIKKKQTNEQTLCMCTRCERSGLVAFLLKRKKTAGNPSWSLVECYSTFWYSCKHNILGYVIE